MRLIGCRYGDASPGQCCWLSYTDPVLAEGDALQHFWERGGEGGREVVEARAA